MEQLWAPWRLAYVQEAGTADGCVFCREAAGELGDASLVIRRGERAFVLLNKFPYSSGHLMVAPLRHIPALGADARHAHGDPDAHPAGQAGARRTFASKRRLVQRLLLLTALLEDRHEEDEHVWKAPERVEALERRDSLVGVRQSGVEAAGGKVEVVAAE